MFVVVTCWMHHTLMLHRDMYIKVCVCIWKLKHALLFHFSSKQQGTTGSIPLVSVWLEWKVLKHRHHEILRSVPCDVKTVSVDSWVLTGKNPNLWQVIVYLGQKCSVNVSFHLLLTRALHVDEETLNIRWSFKVLQVQEY